MIHYFATLKTAKLVLWCYLIWYGMTVSFHFDASPTIWYNSLGISFIIGIGLFLSVSRPGVKADFRQIARLFLMPFCVSSFSALIKGRGFILIFSPSLRELLFTMLACLLFVSAIMGLKLFGTRFHVLQQRSSRMIERRRRGPQRCVAGKGPVSPFSSSRLHRNSAPEKTRHSRLTR